MEDFDLVVIGTGTAAMVAATRVSAAGRRVAVVDVRPFGGTCALRGCDPKKMLVSGASAYDRARRMAGKGLAGDLRIDWPELIRFKRGFTDPIPAKHEQIYHDKGISAFHGLARFTGPDLIDVGSETLRFRHTLIAAGAEPMRLGIPGEEHLATNEDFLQLETLPPRIVLVGGGYIAAEFSHIAARAGAEVTILQRAGQLLPHFDPDLVGWLMPRFSEIGVNVHLNAEARSIERVGGAYRVHADSAGERRVFEADLVIHAAGRRPALEDLDLDAANVAHDHGRLQLNAFLQSISNAAVYAVGDAAQAGPPLTPVSSHDAKVVAANILSGNSERPNYAGVPSVAFTIPPIAAAGLTEREAASRGLRHRIKSEFVPDWFTARAAAEPIYGFKVLVEDGSDLILGAHLVGPRADEVINLFALAIRHGLTATDLKTTMFAYPTGASDIGSMLPA